MAYRIMGLEFKSAFMRLTLGGISSKELARAGHPFGRSTPGDMESRMRGLDGTTSKGPGGGSRRAFVRKKYPLNPINKQTGNLHDSITIRPVMNVASIMAYDVMATVPYAKYVLHPLGTPLMVGRDMMTGHALGRSAPGMLERFWRANQREFRIRYKSAV